VPVWSCDQLRRDGETKIQTTVNDPPVPSEVMVAGNAVEIVEKFTYPGSHLDHNGEVLPKSYGV